MGMLTQPKLCLPSSQPSGDSTAHEMVVESPPLSHNSVQEISSCPKMCRSALIGDSEIHAFG